MLKNKNIIITGCTGFIASHLLKKLASEGCNILALSRHALVNKFILDIDNVANKTLDLINFSEVKDAFLAFNPHVVFHLASMPDGQENYQHTMDIVDNNIKCTINLLDAFGECKNAESFVYGDSVKVYGNIDDSYKNASPVQPNSSYAISKLAAWHFCRLYANLNQFNAISVRPTLIFGPRQPVNIFDFVIKSVLNGDKEITLMGGNQTRSPLYIEDALDAYIKAVEYTKSTNGLVFNIGGKEELTVINLVKRIVSLMGADTQVHKSMEMQRETEICTSIVDLEETFKCYKWKPGYDLDLAIKETIASYH